jgi:hypothetical protein
MQHAIFAMAFYPWMSTLLVGMLVANPQFAFPRSFASQRAKRPGDQVLLRKTRTPVASKTQLEHLGVTVVTESDNKSYGLVASFPDDMYKLVESKLRQHGVVGFGSSNHGQCGLYVPIRDFFKARKLLLQIKPQLQKRLKASQSKRVWIWNPHRR